MGRSVNFLSELEKRAREADQIIESFLPKEEGFARTLAMAVNYSVKAGGKRIRPILLRETLRLFGGDEKVAEPFMAGIEMIHTHSLIHDDLPALDNDDYRRGKLTTHRMFGEAMGVLSGDALLNLAYETMFKAFSRTDHPEKVIAALRIMGEKTGISGMLGGQSVDVENDGAPLSWEMLEYIYLHKTAALLEAPMMAGAVLGGAGEREVSLIEEAARDMGLAFQIRDDILDVTGTSEELGKPAHSDEKNHKVTCVTLFGVEEAARRVSLYSREALGILENMEGNNEFLSELVKYLAERRK